MSRRLAWQHACAPAECRNPKPEQQETAKSSVWVYLLCFLSKPNGRTFIPNTTEHQDTSMLQRLAHLEESTVLDVWLSFAWAACQDDRLDAAVTVVNPLSCYPPPCPSCTTSASSAFQRLPPIYHATTLRNTKTRLFSTLLNARVTPKTTLTSPLLVLFCRGRGGPASCRQRPLAPGPRQPYTHRLSSSRSLDVRLRGVSFFCSYRVESMVGLPASSRQPPLRLFDQAVHAGTESVEPGREIRQTPVGLVRQQRAQLEPRQGRDAP